MNYHLIPNWVESVNETYEFRTTIFTSHSGKEQRMAERLTPRRTISFRTLLWDERLQNFQAWLHNRGSDTISIPDPARMAALLARPALKGDTSLVFEVYPAWLRGGIELSLSDLNSTEFTGGSTVVRLQGEFNNDYNAREFDVNQHISIKLTKPLERNWPEGTVVRPVVTGRLAKNITLSHETVNIAQANLLLDVEIPAAMPNFASKPFIVHRGLPFFGMMPNWSNPPEVEYSTPFEDVDYQRGVTRTYLPVDFHSRITQFNYLGRGHGEIGRICTLFNQMRGRQGEFYCPSGTSDMVVSGGATAGSSYLTIRGRALLGILNRSTVNRDIAIRLSDGSWILRRVLLAEATSSPGPGAFNTDYNPAYDAQLNMQTSTMQYTRLSLGFPFEGDIDEREIVMVSWANVSRFASDTLTVQWMTDDAARVALQISTLEALPAET